MMKLQDGPAFGAIIIGVGLAVLIWMKTQNILLALFAGLGVAILDYVFLIWVSNLKKK